MQKRKKTIAAECRAKAPELFVKVTGERGWPYHYARAHIRVKAGEYNYLVWRDGERIRNLYLGRKRKP
jgi:hypothetical protein